MKIKTNRKDEAQKEDYLSVNIYEHISILPTAWCPLNNENFYTVIIYWKKEAEFEPSGLAEIFFSDTQSDILNCHAGLKFVKKSIRPYFQAKKFTHIINK